MKKIVTVGFLRPEASLILPRKNDEGCYEHSGVLVVPSIILPKANHGENRIVRVGGQVLLLD